MAEAQGAQPTIEQAEEQFADAFAQAAQAAEKGEPLPSEPPAGEPAKKPEENAGGEPAAGEPAKKPEDSAAQGSQPPAGEDTVKAAAGADTVAGSQGDDKGKDGGDAAAAPPVDKTPPPAAPPPAAEPPPKVDDKPLELTAEQKAAQEQLAAALADYTFTDAETKAIEKFKADFPEEAVAIDARFKQIERVITQRVYNSAVAVLERVQALVAPAVEGYTQSAAERRQAAVIQKHVDYPALQPKVTEWVKQQPARLRSAYEDVLAQGTADEIVAVVDQYKKNTGQAAAPAAAPPAAPAKPAATKDEVDALASVSGKRATPAPKGSVDMNDYDSAWKEAVGAK